MLLIVRGLAGLGALTLAVALGAVVGGMAGEEPEGMRVAWQIAGIGAALVAAGVVAEILWRRSLRR